MSSYSRLLCFLILIWDLVIFEVFFIKFNYNNRNMLINYFEKGGKVIVTTFVSLYTEFVGTS